MTYSLQICLQNPATVEFLHKLPAKTGETDGRRGGGEAEAAVAAQQRRKGRKKARNGRARGQKSAKPLALSPFAKGYSCATFRRTYRGHCYYSGKERAREGRGPREGFLFCQRGSMQNLFFERRERERDIVGRFQRRSLYLKISPAPSNPILSRGPLLCPLIFAHTYVDRQTDSNACMHSANRWFR